MNKLTDLKPGDTVVLRRHLETSTVAKVDRITPTQIVVKIKNTAGTAHDHHFYKKNGYAVGSSDSWRPTSIEVGTPERLAEIAETQLRRELIGSIKGCDLTKLRTHTLTCIRSWMYDSGNYIEPKQAL